MHYCTECGARLGMHPWITTLYEWGNNIFGLLGIVGAVAAGIVLAAHIG